MNTQSRLKLAVLAASTLLVTQLHAEPSGKGNGETPNGVPFKHLQEQIDQNKADLDALAASTRLIFPLFFGAACPIKEAW